MTDEKPIGEKPKGRNYSRLGLLFAILSLFVLPIIFGPLAIAFGIAGIVKGDKKWGVLVIVLGVVLAVISIFGAMLLRSIF